ncbi:hypothetical protein BS78_07G149800 [Paspalum vaginatum]|nr:hypothetical protein BS78_07G149800 [Paspalum vaginatum]
MPRFDYIAAADRTTGHRSSPPPPPPPPLACSYVAPATARRCPPRACVLLLRDQSTLSSRRPCMLLPCTLWSLGRRLVHTCLNASTVYGRQCPWNLLPSSRLWLQSRARTERGRHCVHSAAASRRCFLDFCTTVYGWKRKCGVAS